MKIIDSEIRNVVSGQNVRVHGASSALLNAASTSKSRSKPKPKTTQDA